MTPNRWTPTFSVLGWIGWAGNVLVLILAAYQSATGDDILELHLHTDDPASAFALFSIGGMILWLLAGSTTLEEGIQTPKQRRQFLICLVTLLLAVLVLGGLRDH